MILAILRQTRHGLPVLLTAVLLATTACRAPLPRLQKYDNSGVENTEWQLGTNETTESTVDRLIEHPDSLVRKHAEQARADLDELAADREARRLELLASNVDELDLAGEVALIEVDTTDIPNNVDPVQIRDALVSKALEAEVQGRIGEAFQLANTAIALESMVYDRFEDSSSTADMRELARRTSRRLDLIKLVDPQLANRLLDPDQADPATSEDAQPMRGSSQLRSKATALANGTALVELMQRNHVDGPRLDDMHRAGLEEIVAISELLTIYGNEESKALAVAIANSDQDLESMRTMALLARIDRIQEETAASSLPRKFAIRVFVEGAAGSLDQRTSVVWPDEFARYRRQAGRLYRGIGTSVERRFDGTVVLDPIPGGPASRAGVRTGDRVLQIENVPVRNLSLEELTLMATDPERTSIEVLLERGPEDEQVQIEIKLGVVMRPHTNGWQQKGMANAAMPTWNWLVDTDARIAYVRLDGFRAGGDRAIRLALQEAQAQANAEGGPLEGLILDLRGNGGGQVSVAEEVANLFVRDGTIFRSTDGQKQVDDDRARRSHAELVGMPLAILVDESSASASELVAGMLQARSDALVIGDRTFGKGSIQTPLRAFTNDCMVLVTTGWYLLPPGSGNDSLEWRYVDRAKVPLGWGVQPDVHVPMSAEETAAALAFRARWYSGVGPDRAPTDTLSIEPPPDPAAELAIALLRARIIDARTNDLSARVLFPR